MQKKRILTDTFTFEDLIGRNCLYVDKTRYFHKLVSDGGKCYFLSRPRRFGKSLAVSILKNIFLGRRDIFKGLYIDGTDYDWQEFPIIHLDIARINVRDAECLEKSLHKKLHEIADDYGIKLEDDSAPDEFDSLISKLKKKFGRNVVILIDEYDRPLTENIDNAEKLETMRSFLSEFYQMIKGGEPDERFVFITGVTRFSKVSIFSKLNNLDDISMTSEYGEMFGYTQEELEANFAPYIDEHIAKTNCNRAEFIAEIKRWYDGFKFYWKSENVYNPVSIGQFFAKGCEFRNYWFATGTPTFITKLAKKQNLTQEDIDRTKLSVASLDTFDIAEIAGDNVSTPTMIQLLFQTGYLTIGKTVNNPADMMFHVRFPNYEIDVSFSRILFEVCSGMNSKTAVNYVADITEAADNNDIGRMVELFKNFISGIPYTIQNQNEKYYQTIIFCILKMCGMNVEAENATNKGRIDAVFDIENYVYILEFKLDKNADEAVEQILQKKYFQKFIEGAKAKQKKIVGLGINFSTAERNITEWKACEVS